MFLTQKVAYSAYMSYAKGNVAMLLLYLVSHIYYFSHIFLHSPFYWGKHNIFIYPIYLFTHILSHGLINGNIIRVCLKAAAAAAAAAGGWFYELVFEITRNWAVIHFINSSIQFVWLIRVFRATVIRGPTVAAMSRWPLILRSEQLMMSRKGPLQ